MFPKLNGYPSDSPEGLVAQWIRASPSGGEGQRFEPSRDHHKRRGEIPSSYTTVIAYNLSDGERRKSKVSARGGQANPPHPVE